MSSGINKNIGRLIEILGISPYEFSRQIGNQRADNIYNILKGKVDISPTTLNKIFSRYPEHKDLVLFGEKHIQTNIVRDNRGFVGNIQGVGNTVSNYTGESNVSKAISCIADDLVQVPFVSRSATAGFIESNCDRGSISETLPVFGVTQEELAKNNYIVFEISGDSMEPTLNDKARILAKFVDPNNWEYADSGVFVVCYRDHLVAKRIKSNTMIVTDTLKLVSDSARGGETVVRKSDIRAIWKAVRIVDQAIT